MKLVILSIFDNKAELFNNPLFVQTQAQAARGFSNVVIDGTQEFHKNPEDYELMELGTFDPSDGSFSLHEKPQKIIDAAEILELHYKTTSKEAAQ